MQYMLIIYDDPKVWNDMSPEERGRIHGEYMQFTQSIKTSGHYRSGEALQPTTTATTLRVRGGKTQTLDGPFAETKEQLAGYYVVEAKDLDEARQIATRIPSARIGSVEIRPVVDFTKSGGM